MAAKDRDIMPDLDSDCETTETSSSSGLENYDVAFYCHETLKENIIDAETSLNADGIETCLNVRDSPAGRSKPDNLFSIARHSKLRVFIITEKFISSGDFAYCLRLLENAELSTKHNTLLLMKKNKQRHIPDHLKNFPCEIFCDRISGDHIVDFINKFRKELLTVGCLAEEPLDVQCDDENKSRVTEKDLQKYTTKSKKFGDMFGNKLSKKRSYILVASHISRQNPDLQHIASIPWIRVFDFDPKSRVSGLLSWSEGSFGDRHHTKTDNLDKINLPNDNITDWVFLTGYTDSPDTLHMENRGISEHLIYAHFESLSDYCVGKKVPVILVMWYPKHSNMDKNFDVFLSGLRYHFMGRLQNFNCIVCVDKMPNKRSPLYGMLERLNLLDSSIVVPIEILCHWIHSVSDGLPPNTRSNRILPKFPDQGEDLISVEVEEAELVWIKIQLNILVMSNNPSDVLTTSDRALINTKGTAFLKGEEIDWDVLEQGCFDAKRDLVKEAKKYIEETHINTGKTGLVTIFHSPGGGGTTFARRLLFELRTMVPCAELISDQIILKNLTDRLLSIRNLTRLPTILLLDGRPMHEVKKILTIGIKTRVIVIHVRRYYGESAKSSVTKGKFFLGAHVSREEANEFGKIYSKHVPEKITKIQKITERVHQGESLYVFEYGMTAFQTQFQGVRRYVHGYLQIRDVEDLCNWHTILVFLSMANYYGHRGLPCMLFGKLLNKKNGEMVDLDDLPHSASQFITETNENWKITHYIVSKLILEQVLVMRSSIDYHSETNSLTREASGQLCKWASRFIENVREHIGNSSSVPSHLCEILTSIFIRRNYDDPGEKDSDYKSKSHYSRLLEEASSNQDQGEILNNLVDKFPNQAEFRAHLGRFYSKQGDFEKADSCFKLAIDTRKNETRVYGAKISPTKQLSDQVKGDDVLARIYTMAGYACMSQIRGRIGVRLGNLKKSTLRDKIIPTLVKSCLEKAQQAVKNFEDGRLWYRSGSNPSFANVGELKVRLQITELASMISDGNYQSLLKKAQSFHKELGVFVLRSFHECDVLLAHYISDRSRNFDVPEEEINFCFNQFNSLYSTATDALEKWAGGDSSIHSMKCHLSIFKIKLRNGKKWFRLNEDVKTSQQINNLVQLCERICKAVLSDDHSNVRISSYVMEWLRAIRHKRMQRQYSLLDVLTRVEEWKSLKEIGSLANFYYYVLNTTLAVCSISPETAIAYSNESRKSKDYIRQNAFPSSHLMDTGEWLACGDGSQNFNRLISSLELGDWKGKFWTDKEQISRLKVCTGFISFCQAYDGRIVIDGGRNTPIGVYFVPQKYTIGISHSMKKTRVEFYVGFNPRHFAEAYEVTPLRKYACPNPSCKSPTEIPVLGKKTEECVATCNICETLVKIPMETA